MATGTIKTLMKDRGFGFIQVEGTSKDLFFHSSSIADASFDSLQEGQSVEFETEPDPRDPKRERASKVKLLS